MYKINDIQIYTEVDGYIPFHKKVEYNEIELLPSKDTKLNTVVQAGITTRGRINFLAYVFDYNNYLKLMSLQMSGAKVTFSDRFNEYDNLIIFDIGEPVRQNDEVIGFDIELMEV